MSNLSVSSPWAAYYHKLRALFGDDPDIRIVYDNDNVVIDMYVNGNDKADALSKLLPEEVDFGNVKLTVNVIPANNECTEAELIRRAFLGNPHFVDVLVIDGSSTNPFTYCIFEKEVIQYHNDNLADPNGNESVLAQDIAKELFKTNGVYYCTDIGYDE